jgi:hypothetical protein
MSTSVAYLRKRLLAIGRNDLVEAVEGGRGISMYAAAEEAGLVTRRQPLGTGSPNMTKKRLWAMAKVVNKTVVIVPRDEPAQPKVSQPPPPPPRDILDVKTRAKPQPAKTTKSPN